MLMSDDFLLRAVGKRRTKLRRKNLAIATITILFLGAGGGAAYTVNKNQDKKAAQQPESSEVADTQTQYIYESEVGPQTSVKPEQQVEGDTTTVPNTTAPPAETNSTNKEQAHRSKDRRTFRVAATEAASKLGDVNKLLTRNSWDSDDIFIRQIHQAKLKIISARSAVTRLNPSDKDPAVTKQQQAAKNKLSSYASKLQEAVNAYETWTDNRLGSTLVTARSLRMQANNIAISFYNVLSGLPL